MKVQIVEVGPRDGLQNESSPLSVQQRVELVKKLTASKLSQIEVGAFVSPKWIPQMQNSDYVIQQLWNDPSISQDMKTKGYSALVPNEHGMFAAMKTPIQKVAIFGSCTESFSQKNINCSIEESFNRFQAVMKHAKKSKIKVRGYLSVAFGCPYEGKVDPKKVVQLTQRMLKLGVYEVSIGDTIGVATPKQVKHLIQLLKRARVPMKKIALHMHDTRGTALANVLAGLELGVQIFDSSVCGLGGCPYAKGSAGNLATEDLVYMLEGMGLKTGVDLKKLIEIRGWLNGIFRKELPGRTSKAGLPQTQV